MDICFEGIGQTAATFRAESGIGPGMAVTLTGSGTVGLGEDGDPPCGVALGLGGARGGAAAVQIGGAAKVGWSGDTLSAGWQSLACDGQGGVKTVSAGGVKWLVLAVDEDAKTAVVKL